MGRNSAARINGQRRPQSSKRTRKFNQEQDLMVRFNISRDHDREGMGR